MILSPNLLCHYFLPFYYSSVGLIQQLKIEQEGWQERARHERIQIRYMIDRHVIFKKKKKIITFLIAEKIEVYKLKLRFST